MKTPVEFFRELPSYPPERDQWCINALAARDKEIKVEALRMAAKIAMAHQAQDGIFIASLINFSIRQAERSR